MEIDKTLINGIHERLSIVLLSEDLPSKLYFELLNEIYYKLRDELTPVRIPIFTLQKFNNKNGHKI